MKPLTLTSPPFSSLCEIYFGLDQLDQVCLKLSKKGVLIVDERIADTHGEKIEKELSFEMIAIPNEKSRKALMNLEDQLLKKKCGKETLLIALGGGTITDLVAFSASTYMRGVPLVLIPTTLLGMVDAAIGGKTGIDTPFGKNLIGSFYLPRAIFIDPSFLTTLSEKELKNGMSEILKYGLIGDPLIWERAKDWKNDLLALIEASVSLKCKVVEADFEEKKGYRRILNFGHTVGHALEVLSNYHMPHGEAVALGLMAESYLSYAMGYLPKETLDLIVTPFLEMGFRFNKIDPHAFKEALSYDKKGKDGLVRFVMIDQIGHPLSFNGEYCSEVEPKKIDQMIEWMHRHG